MKRLLCIFIILVLALPLLTLPISAEEAENAEFVIFENGKYVVTIGAIKEEDKKEFINILVKHTGVSYEDNLNTTSDSPRIYIGAYGTTENLHNKITHYNKDLYISFNNPESKDTLFTDFSQKLKNLPQDKIVLDSSFLGDHYEDNVGENSSDTAQTSNTNFWVKTFKGLLNFINIFKGIEDDRTTLTSGGFNFIGKESRLNILISAIYRALYPIGFTIMLVCWAFGIAKSTISASLDIKDKSSIIHSIISLIIGVGAMSLAPYILTILTSASQWLCSLINAADYLNWENWNTVTDIDIIETILNGTSNLGATALVLEIVDYVFMLNILWIALLQCLSPIFIALMANTNTRKISFNFIKEYFKAMLMPVITLIYYKLSNALLWDLDPLNGGHGSFGVGLIGALVLGIATVSIAGKKLDKLIN